VARPDFNLCVKKVEGNAPFSQIGVAWSNDKGQLRIKLNPCVTLTDREDITIYLFPADAFTKQGLPRQERPSQDNFDYGPPPMTDDDVPF